MPSSHDNLPWLFAQIAKPVKRGSQPLGGLDRAAKLLNTARPCNANYRGLVAAMMTA
jgi:hypothetical protein